MKKTFHSSFFVRNVGMYANGNAPDVNPFIKDLNGGALWTLLDSYNSEAGEREDGILDIDRRLADHGLGLGVQSSYPRLHGMVAKRLVGCDEDLVLGVRPTRSGLDIVLASVGAHADDAIETWSLPLAEGMDAVDDAIDQIIHDVSEKIRPHVGLSVSP